MYLQNSSIDLHDDLSTTQISILKAIMYFSEKHGFPPTVREICDMVELKSTSTVYFHLNKLDQKGYIEKNAFSPRSITVTDKSIGEGFYSDTNVNLDLSDELKLMMKNLKSVVTCDDLYTDNIQNKKKTLFSICQLVTDALIKMDSVNM